MSIREKLANLEHEQWIKWAMSLMDSENLSPERVERWKKYMVPYSELDEKTKDYDRKWADKIIKLLEEHDWKNYNIADATLIGGIIIKIRGSASSPSCISSTPTAKKEVS